MNDKTTSYSFDGISSLNITGSSGIVTMGLISRDKLEPIEPPRFVPEPKLTIDQQVARAQSIVRVIVEAQAGWDKIQIAKGFQEARLLLLYKIPFSLDILKHKLGGHLRVSAGSGGGVGGMLPIPMNMPRSMAKFPTKYIRKSGGGRNGD